MAVGTQDGATGRHGPGRDQHQTAFMPVRRGAQGGHLTGQAFQHGRAQPPGIGQYRTAHLDDHHTGTGQCLCFFLSPIGLSFHDRSCKGSETFPSASGGRRLTIAQSTTNSQHPVAAAVKEGFLIPAVRVRTSLRTSKAVLLCGRRKNRPAMMRGRRQDLPCSGTRCRSRRGTGSRGRPAVPRCPHRGSGNARRRRGLRGRGTFFRWSDRMAARYGKGRYGYRQQSNLSPPLMKQARPYL